MTADSFIDFYQEELRALRKDAYLFGKRHPEMASALGLHWGDTQDPMVERLLEGTAWFAARIRRDSQALLPFAAQRILRTLHPHLVSPIPSIGIASLTPRDGFAAAFPAGRTLPAGSRFHSRDAEGGVVRWRTGWPLLLSGAKVVRHGFDSADGYRLNLTVENIGALPSLRLFLRGDPRNTHPLHQWVHCNCVDVSVFDERPRGDGKPIRLGADALRPGGLSPEDLVLPGDASGYSSYQLLLEYFVCPERFLFWDLDLSRYAERGGTATISLRFRLPPPAGVSADFLQFDACAVPVVNLYETLAEPIPVDHTRHSHRLDVDRARPEASEVHSVLEVEALLPGGRSFVIPRHGDAASAGDGGAPALWRWYERRVRRVDGDGTDVELFFKTPDVRDLEEPFTVSVRALCTDRGRAAAVGNAVRLENDDEMDMQSAFMERPPTRQYDPPADGDTLWRLVAAVTARGRPLSGKDGTQALKELLRLVVPDGCAGGLAQVEGIAGLECADTLVPLRASRLLPMGGAAWGHAFTLRLVPEAFAGSSPFLFASVIESFLALFAGVHSFTQLTAFAGEELRRWPARSGRRRL